MKKSFSVVVAVCAVFGAIVTLSLPAQADMLSLWRLNETSGSVAPNSLPIGNRGNLTNSPAWVNDPTRGQVLSFNGSSQAVDASGWYAPALGVNESFTWSFWAYNQDSPNNDVMVGNRNGGANNSWAKFTTNQFEYVAGFTASGNQNYADIPTNEWHHHAVVKNGSSITYYRDGVASSPATTSVAMPNLPFYMGGDTSANECWQGRLSDVALFNHALTPAELTTVMSGNFSAYLPAKATSFSDGFAGGSLDSAKWTAFDKGLESNQDGGYNDPAVSGGTLTLGGTTNYNHWAGKSVATKNTFDVPAGGELRFDVDRVSLNGSGTAWRSSMWLYAGQDQYVHFSQNIGEGGWGYNANNNNPTGAGVNLARADGQDGDSGNHRMSMVHDGAYVKMYLDGKYLGSQAATFSTNMVGMLTGQAWGNTNTVSAVFDNAAVSSRTLRNVYDNFNSGSIDPAKWTVLNKGLENSSSFGGNLNASVVNGVLTFDGATGSQYWYGKTLQSAIRFTTEEGATFSVQREALERGGSSAVRSSIWLWADDNNFLHFSQNWGETGWQYNFADGTRTGASAGGGINIPAFDLLDNDDKSHEMMIALRKSGSTVFMDMFLDGKLGATQAFANWGDRQYYFMITGQPRDNDDSVFAAFDNVQISIPEPATMGLLALGLAGLAGRIRRRF